MNKTRLLCFLILISLPFINGCKQQSKKVVEALVSNILEPVTITVTPDLEMGEILLSDDEQEIIVQIKNNSSDEIRDINFSLDISSKLIDFKPTLDGLIQYPGNGGTCSTILPSGKSCIIKLLFISRKQGEFNISANLKYTNLIQPEEKNVQFHLIAGEPASLIFTNDISSYSLGIFEQTDVTDRFIDLEVQNSGGLPARNLDVSIINDDASPAYKIIEHDCPKKLDVGKKCKIKLSYTPRNNNYTDPETIYTGHIAFNFTRDPMQNYGHLNGYFSFTSATIEAKFKTNFPHIDFGTITAGNKEMRTIKLTNQGYREGILKKLIVKYPRPNANTDALTLTECIKGTGTILNCQKSLYDFPFIIEDQNSCLDNIVQPVGVVGTSPNCFFQITYWPSSNFPPGTQAIHDFNLTTYSFNYDSRWKAATNIVTKDDVFDFKNNFNAKASLAVYSVKLNSILVTKRITANNWLELIDLERLGKVKDATTHNTVEIKFKNTGESPALFSSLVDGKVPTPFSILSTDSAPLTLDPNSPRDLNTFYRSVKLSDECISPIAPGDTNCTLTYDLYTIKQANSIVEDSLLFDNITDLFHKYKIFKFSYKDGGNYEDDGTVVTTRTLETQLESELISKGKLTILTVTPLASTNIVTGDKVEKVIKITNNGTGDVSAFQFFDVANSFQLPKIYTFPYSILNFAAGQLPSDSQKDCNDLAYPSTTVFPFAVDSNKVLREGETCSFRLIIKAAPTIVDINVNSDSSPANIALLKTDYKRFFDHNVNSLPEIWTMGNSGTNSTTLKFKYWDGDDNSAKSSSSFANFGYLGTSSIFTLTSVFITPANIGFSNILSFPSAVIYRPSTSYPAIIQTVPATRNILAASFPSRLFSTNSFSASVAPVIGPSTSAANCRVGTVAPFTSDSTGATQTSVVRDFSLCQFYNNLGVPYTNSNYHMIHLGTFLANQSWTGTINLQNYGSEAATAITLLADISTAGLPIKIKKFGGFTLPDPYLTPQATTGSSIAMDVNVLGTVAGRVQRCYDVTYKSILGNRDLRFCLVADIIATSPKLQISYLNNDSTWDSVSSTFSYAPGAEIAVTSPLTVGEIAPTTTDKLISFQAVTGQPNAAGKPLIWNNDKKIIQIKNIGTAPLTNVNALSNFRVELVLRTTSLLDPKTTVTPPTPAEIAACIPLAVNASCNLTMYFTPKTVSGADNLDYLLFSYAIADKQFINQYVAVRFEGLAAASISVAKYQQTTSRAWGLATGTVGALVTSVNSWLDPTAPAVSAVQNSYSLKLGATTSSLHKLTTTPTTTTFVLDINNASSTKVSFLLANPTPAAGTWNKVYPPTGLASTNNANKVLIEANRGCFYGDDELNAGVAANLKGFNTSTTTINKCQLKVTFQGDVTYSNCVQATKVKVTNLGGNILATCNPYVFTIPFWNFKRTSTANFNTHIEDFIEPSKASFALNTPALKIKYLNTTNTEVKITIPTTITALSPIWGAITKYRILYSPDKTKLSSAEIYRYDYTTATDAIMTTFKSGMLMQETADATTGVTITQNVLNGKYYFIKILAIRQSPVLPGYPTGISYVSDPLIPILSIATPINNTMAYVDALKAYVDKTILNSTLYAQLTATNACVASTFVLNNAGANLTHKKKLISTNEFQYIRAGFVETVNSDLITSYDPGIKSLWLLDAPVAINSSAVINYAGATVTGGYPGFVNTTLIASNGALKLAYNKACSNLTSCNNLGRIVGGDGVDAYSGGVYYTNITKIMGYARCFTPIICPSATTKFLSDPTCL